MKIISKLGDVFTLYVLLAVNLSIIVIVEIVGKGTYFAETGLVHAITLIFIGLIIIRIFSDYTSSDHILRGFLKIQLAATLFFGLMHLYEYIGLFFISLPEQIVKFSIMASYLIWFICAILSVEFVLRIYRNGSYFLTVLVSIVLASSFLILLALNISSFDTQILPSWIPAANLALITLFGAGGLFFNKKIGSIMPIFKEPSQYATPAMILIILTAYSEYFESNGALQTLGISNIQNLYISHFLLYGALSLLYIAFGKLQKPKGIYEEKVGSQSILD